MFVENEKIGKADSQVCCLPFKPEFWDDIKHSWSNKLFLKDSVPEIFHVPLPGTYEKSIARMWKKAEVAGAKPDPSDFLLLAHAPFSFKGELYMAVTKDVPGGQTVKLIGDFFSKSS